MDGLAGSTWDRGETRFSRRGAVSAPAWQGRTQGEACRNHPGRATGRQPKRPALGFASCHLSGRAEPAPPRGASPARMALRRSAGDDARGVFLGGAHSVRPRGKDGRKARHNIIIGGKGTPGGPVGTCPESSQNVPSGRAEPAPPRGGLSELGWPSGENPGITRKMVFSEGRGLRARMARPDARRGMS
jgi:hypothetical protein